MELVAVNNNVEDNVVEEVTTNTSFIQANTLPMAMEEIRHRHIIPVFAKDNESTISHTEFIETVRTVAGNYFHGATLGKPDIRVSHPIKGRIPEARNKPVKDLQPHEKTLYYERMAFTIELPDIQREVNGQKLSLMVGGVKAYNEDNLYNKKGAQQHFKIFIGFQNKVCLNLCISTDGLKANLKITDFSELGEAMNNLISGFQAERHLELLQEFNEYQLSEAQFAQLIGKSKLYQFLPTAERKQLPELPFGDYQMNTMAKDYYSNQSFSRNTDGSISLWNVYNLFTGSNKSSYIDRFLERGANATDFVSMLTNALKAGKDCWFLN